MATTDYVPLPTPAKFHASMASRRWNVGGLGSSKSRPLVEELWKLGAKYQGLRALVVRKTFPSLQESTMRFFEERCPRELIESENKQEHKKVMYNGSTYLFRSFENAEMIGKVMSDEFDVIAIDELGDFKEEEVRKIEYRKRKGIQKSIYAGNSSGQDWSYEKFYPGEDTLCPHFQTCSLFRQDWCKRPVQRMVTREIEIDGKMVQQTFEMFVTCTKENPYLPPEYIAELQMLPDDEKKRYFYCSFDIFVGQIYSEWNDHVHLVDVFDIPEDWKRYRILDHGVGHPTAVLWMAVNPEGFAFFYDEHYKKSETPDYHAPYIHAKSHDAEWRGQSLADPHIFDRTQVGKKDEGQVACRHSVADLYRAKGLVWRKADNAKEVGKLQVKQYLKVYPNLRHPLTGELGSPMAFVLKGRCPNLVRQIKGLKYKPDSEEWVDVEDDTTDCARYGLMALPRVVEKKIIVPGRMTYRDLYAHVDGLEGDNFRMGYRRGRMIGI